jgi:hypothetical protein
VTALHDEIQHARKRIAREGYDMSIGELASLYEQGELIISPPYQRLFRWEDEQKSRFVESIFLNVPIPAIFVFTRTDGKWELVDGLQRVSTCLQFLGKHPTKGRFVCDGTNLVPSLSGVFWPTDADNEAPNALPADLQLNFRRARLRVEILGPDTDADVRFELFQRLNAGGTQLTEQEVRSCIIYSVNPTAFDHLQQLAQDDNLLALMTLSDQQSEQQYAVELVVRTICLRHVKYDNRTDVHEFLNRAIIEISGDEKFNWVRESKVLRQTYAFIREQIGDKAFWKGQRKSLALYEFVALATSKLIDQGGNVDTRKYKKRFAALQNDPDLERYSGAGVRGTDRWRGFVAAKADDYFTR